MMNTNNTNNLEHLIAQLRARTSMHQSTLDEQLMYGAFVKLKSMQEILDRWRHAGVLSDTPLMQETCKVLGLIEQNSGNYFDQYKCGHEFLVPDRGCDRTFEVPCPDCYEGEKS